MGSTTSLFRRPSARVDECRKLEAEDAVCGNAPEENDPEDNAEIQEGSDQSLQGITKPASTFSLFGPSAFQKLLDEEAVLLKERVETQEKLDKLMERIGSAELKNDSKLMPSNDEISEAIVQNRALNQKFADLKERYEQYKRNEAELFRRLDKRPFHYDIDNLQKSVTIYKNNSLILDTPTDGSCVPLIGGSVYDGAKALAEYLDESCKDSSWIRGRKVLDLGGGTGYVGIVAAMLGGDVTITDLPQMIPLMEKNIAANSEELKGSGGKIRAHGLRWGDAESIKSLPKQDVILMSDVIYYHQSIEPLVSTCVALSHRGTKLVVFSTLSDRGDLGEVWRDFFNHASTYFKLSPITLEEFYEATFVEGYYRG